MKHAIKMLRSNKASEADGVPGEVLKCAGEALAVMLYAFFQPCWRFRFFPQDFDDASTITLFKDK